MPHSNYYTEAYSAPLRDWLAGSLGVPSRNLHINAGSELILRQLFERLGEQDIANEFACMQPASAVPVDV